MDSNPDLLFATLLACLIVWQLAAGYTLGGKFGWRADIFHEHSPRNYWLSILCEFVTFVTFLITGATSWEWSSSSHEEEEVATVATPTRAEKRRAEAFDLHNKQQPAQAIAIYDELLRESGDDAELLYWRGMAHGRLGDHEAALQDFRRVIELEPGNLDAHRVADRTLSRQKRWDEVLAIWNAYIRASPSDAEAYYERGGTHFRKGDLAAAHADAARACELGKAEACPLAARLGTKP